MTGPPCIRWPSVSAQRGMADARRAVELVLSRKDPGIRLPLTFRTEHPASAASLPWSAVDQIAVKHLHLGDPTSARRIWSEATAPSPALRLTRLAEADFAASMPRPRRRVPGRSEARPDLRRGVVRPCHRDIRCGTRRMPPCPLAGRV